MLSTFVEFAILGLGIGGLYSLSALGIVVIYRASATINFAQGAMGMVGAYCYWQLHDQHSWPFAAAFPVAVMISAALGALSYLLVIGRLRRSTMVTRLLATLGILALLQALVEIKFPEELEDVRSSLPTKSIRLLGTRVSQTEVWLLIIAVLLSLALAVFYRKSRFGLATTAVAENRRTAAALGHSPHSIASINWTIGAGLAGVAGVLLAPVTGLSISEFTTLLIPSLAAAVVGNMTSFSITLAAGLAIGVVESELTRYFPANGWSDAFPFLVVVVVLAFRGRPLPGRGETAEKFPSVGTGRINISGIIVVVAAVVTLVMLLPDTWVSGITTTISFGVILLSVVVVTGYTGQLSLCQFTLAGVGAYVAGRLIADYHIPLELALLAAIVVAIPVGFIVGLPALGSRGANLAMATLCVAVAIESVLFDSASLTGGAYGTNIGSPSFFGISMNAVTDPRGYALVVLFFAVAVGLLVANLRRSRTGRQLLAVRVNERAASALGVNVFGAKMRSFVIGSMVAALGGVLWAFMGQTVLYSSFDWLSSVTATGLGVIGGLGYAAGPYFGASLQPGSIGTNIGSLLGSNVQPYLLLFGGAILIAVLLQSPDGIAAKMARDGLRLRDLVLGIVWPKRKWKVASDETMLTQLARERSENVRRHSSSRAMSELSVEEVLVRFGGVTAVDSVSLSVRGGEVVGIIGPNGAGKTTLIEVMMGFIRHNKGRVILDGHDISRLPPRARAGLGLGMTFQSLELFEDMTVSENLLVAAEVERRRSVLHDVVRPGRPSGTAAMQDAIYDFGLRGDLNQIVKELPYGRRRLVAVARAVTALPSILLLDEPVAGLSTQESLGLQAVVRRLAESGTGIALIEHDVEFVMATCDRIVVLDFGRVIADGTPASVRTDPAVISAYLGVGSVEEREGATEDVAKR